MTKARDLASGAPAPAGVSTTELGYVDGVTSAIQTQLNQKPEFTAGKNKFINADFGIWQRGTTFTGVGSGVYTADRFQTAHDGTGTVTVSRQAFTPGAAPVAGYEGTYFLRHQIASTGTTTFFQMAQPIEDVRTFAGRTVTMSFWAKADAARNMVFYLEQAFGGGGSSGTLPVFATFSITTSWARYSVTFDMSSLSGKTIGTNSMLYTGFRQSATSVGAQMDLWGVQLEVGSTATQFTQAGGGNPQAELALCQRYYWRSGGSQILGNGWVSSTTTFEVIVPLPVTMRTSATFAGATGTSYYYAGIGSSNPGFNSVTAFFNSTNQSAEARFTGTGFTVGQAGYVQTNNAAAYLEASAEL